MLSLLPLIMGSSEATSVEVIYHTADMKQLTKIQGYLFAGSAGEWYNNSNIHSRNSPLLTWRNAFVRVQWNTVGKPQKVQLGNSTTTTSTHIISTSHLMECICPRTTVTHTAAKCRTPAASEPSSCWSWALYEWRRRRTQECSAGESYHNDSNIHSHNSPQQAPAWGYWTCRSARWPGRRCWARCRRWWTGRREGPSRYRVGSSGCAARGWSSSSSSGSSRSSGQSTSLLCHSPGPLCHQLSGTEQQHVVHRALRGWS